MKNQVKRFRTELHLSMRKLAEQCDVTIETIRKIENGKSKPNVYLAMNIAEHLGERVDEVFSLNDQL